MKTLTIEQQQLINAEISRFDIRYHSLKEEITDHIFCEIEHLYHTGKSFELAFIQTFDKWHPLLSPRKDLKYRNVPSFISNTWYNRDDNRWRIAGAITVLLPVLNFSFFKLNNFTLTITLFILSLIGVLFSSILIVTKRKRQTYRDSFIKVKAQISGIILIILSCVLGMIIYNSTKETFSIFSLIALYHFVNITLLFSENRKQRVKQIA
ncbi:hypothetical protein HX071_11935 [Myroides marinus]|uniref:Uncharacterized protein n=1 Tax=Myroides marinus TaxID=703342 RepID=A0A1H6X2S6_9FLAO|nr:hypothetical protein [Myroides marinus]MDM1502904.1 hypothetical protein [Myroides marinus]SEJ21804.1 hypothetical protein SAMN04488018_11725 [Myroides marinus]